MKKLSTIALAALTFASSANAAAIFSPSDPIVGGQVIGDVFEEGTVGFDIPSNNWPGGEVPSFAIDGAGQKYLNFGQAGTGFLVTPQFNGGAGSVVDAIQFWTANDAPERDPGAFQLWGSNATVGGGSSLTDFTPIVVGDLALPETRNAGGAAPLDDANSQTVNFANSASFTSYLVVFDALKNAGAANSMQIADVQIYGSIPEPAALSFLALSSALLMFRRRR